MGSEAKNDVPKVRGSLFGAAFFVANTAATSIRRSENSSQLQCLKEIATFRFRKLYCLNFEVVQSCNGYYQTHKL